MADSNRCHGQCHVNKNGESLINFHDRPDRPVST